MQPEKAPTVVDPLAAARFVARVEGEIALAGLRVETSADFEALNRVCDNTAGKDPTSEPFSRSHFDVLPEDGLWVRGIDRQDRTVHIQAMRRDRLDGVSLVELWRRQLWRIHVERNTGAQLGSAVAPAAHDITGTCVYHGEMWVEPGLRGRGLAGLLAQLALGLALVKWAPDYVWGFVAADLVHRGFPVTEGYMHMQPEGVSWHRAPPNIRSDDWLVWMSRADLIYLMARPPEAQARARG